MLLVFERYLIKLLLVCKSVRRVPHPLFYFSRYLSVLNIAWRVCLPNVTMRSLTAPMGTVDGRGPRVLDSGDLRCFQDKHAGVVIQHLNELVLLLRCNSLITAIGKIHVYGL